MLYIIFTIVVIKVLKCVFVVLFFFFWMNILVVLGWLKCFLSLFIYMFKAFSNIFFFCSIIIEPSSVKPGFETKFLSNLTKGVTNRLHFSQPKQSSDKNTDFITPLYHKSIDCCLKCILMSSLIWNKIFMGLLVFFSIENHVILCKHGS